jgi:hypothetical protein
MKKLILAAAIFTVGTLVHAQEANQPRSDSGHRWMGRGAGHKNDRRVAAREVGSPGQVHFPSERVDRPHSRKPLGRPSKFHYQGKEYENFQAFKKSAAYATYRLENEMAAARFNAYLAEKEERRDAAIRFELYRRQYRVSSQFWMDENPRMTATVGSATGGSRGNRLYEPPPVERAESVQRGRPRPADSGTSNREIWVVSQ